MANIPKELTPAQMEARAPEPRAGERLTQLLSRSWDKFHEAAIPRAKIHYVMVVADRAISVLERGVSALERIADQMDGGKRPQPRDAG